MSDGKPTRDELLKALQDVLAEGHTCTLPHGECAWWRARNLLAGVPPGLSVADAVKALEGATWHEHRVLRGPDSVEATIDGEPVG